MTARTTLLLAGLLLVTAPASAAPVPAGDPGAAFKPTVTVRVQPADQLLSDVRYVLGLMARFAPTDNEAKEFATVADRAIDRALGPNWRKAVDSSRPILAY